MALTRVLSRDIEFVFDSEKVELHDIKYKGNLVFKKFSFHDKVAESSKEYLSNQNFKIAENHFDNLNWDVTTKTKRNSIEILCNTSISIEKNKVNISLIITVEKGIIYIKSFVNASKALIYLMSMNIDAIENMDVITPHPFLSDKTIQMGDGEKINFSVGNTTVDIESTWNSFLEVDKEKYVFTKNVFDNSRKNIKSYVASYSNKNFNAMQLVFKENNV